MATYQKKPMPKASRKERLDKVLVDRGFMVTRAQAQALIMDGKVKIKGIPICKPGTLIHEDEPDIVVLQPQPFVSRGGFKLAKALSVFGASAQDRVCIDIGASTGGFTDCLLQNGARFVIAVDVGYGQLDWKLRQDERVQVMEKCNVRSLKPESLDHAPSLGVVDTSFISLSKVLPALNHLLLPNAEIIALLKPQFEYKGIIEDSSFRGVVKGAENHIRIIQSVLEELSALLPTWTLMGLDFSPITGPKGNIEFLLYYKKEMYLEKDSPREAWKKTFLERIESMVLESYREHQFKPN